MHSSIDIKKIKKDLDNNKTIVLCAKQCGVVGDLTTLKICYLLRYYPGLNVSAIANLTGTSISNVSHCLSKLKKKGIIVEQRSSLMKYYSLKDSSFIDFIDVLFK